MLDFTVSAAEKKFTLDLVQFGIFISPDYFIQKSKHHKIYLIFSKLAPKHSSWTQTCGTVFNLAVIDNYFVS
jgi:TRAP-type mannitol/chloroaromatic compound transport system permease small subunit